MAATPPMGGIPPAAKPILLPHRKSTIRNLAILLVVGEGLGWLGYFGTKATEPLLATAFANASVTLFFGALLGGVIQVLFSDLELRRANRAANAEFIGNILADLKAVNDRLERAKTLILAHQSAKTYGDEVRDLIESRVKLLNVIRALHNDPRAKPVRDIEVYVLSMENYLDKIVHEFQTEYKPSSGLQKLYESQIDNALKGNQFDLAENVQKANKPWQKISELSVVKDWMKHDSISGESQERKSDSEYQKHFVKHLNDASRELRSALRDVLKK